MYKSLKYFCPALEELLLLLFAIKWKIFHFYAMIKNIAEADDKFSATTFDGHI